MWDEGVGAGEIRHPILLSNQTGVQQVRTDKNSYNLYTEYKLSEDVSPILYPDFDANKFGIEFHNPILADYRYTDKSIQKMIKTSKVSDKLQKQIYYESAPDISYVVSGGLLNLDQIDMKRYSTRLVEIYDVMTGENIRTQICKLEYNYVTPKKSTIYLGTLPDKKINEQLENQTNENTTWIQQFMDYIAEEYPDAVGRFYDPYAV